VDVLDELGVVDDVDEVVRVLVEEELAGAELDELEDAVEDEEVLVRVCHHGGLGLRHHPPPYASASAVASGTAVAEPVEAIGAATPWMLKLDARPTRAVTVARTETSSAAMSAAANRETRTRAAACLGRYEPMRLLR
jgi:hypothetical protein